LECIPRRHFVAFGSPVNTHFLRFPEIFSRAAGLAQFVMALAGISVHPEIFNRDTWLHQWDGIEWLETD
jgi:hypothetical protein